MGAIWPVGYIKRKMHERAAKHKEESSTDRAARISAVATAWMAIFTLVLVLVGIGTYFILKNQLKEMHEGGTDTHDLAVAAGKQATQTEELAKRMKDQADQTKTIAEQAVVQAQAAQSAAATASDTLRQMKVSFVAEQRPYLIAESPVWVRQPGTASQTAVNFYLKNIGKTPAVKILPYVSLLRHKGLPLTDPHGTDVYVAWIEGAFRDLNQSFIKTGKEKYVKLIRHDLAPGEHFFRTADDEGWNGTYTPLAPVELAELGTGNIDFRLIAIARYADAFNGSYETEFCWFYFGTDPSVWHICDSHNTIK